MEINYLKVQLENLNIHYTLEQFQLLGNQKTLKKMGIVDKGTEKKSIIIGIQNRKQFFYNIWLSRNKDRQQKKRKTNKTQKKRERKRKPKEKHEKNTKTKKGTNSQQMNS